jgi:cell shape-determining protein MreC
MISRQRSKNHILRIFTLLGALLLVVLTLLPIRIADVLFAPIALMVREGERSVQDEFSTVSGYAKGTRRLIDERDQSNRERDTLAQKIETLTASLPRYQEWQEATSRIESKERLASGILAVPYQSPYDTLVIDRGAQGGASLGALVYSNAGAPLGTIIELTPRTAVVGLFTSPGVRTLVYVPALSVLARGVGIGGGVMEVTLPHGTAVRKGTAVTLPTLSGEYIGTIAHTTSDPGEPGVIASVPLHHAYASLRMVFIDKEPYILPETKKIEERLSSFASSTEALMNVHLSIPIATTTVSSSTVASTTSTVPIPRGSSSPPQ